MPIPTKYIADFEEDELYHVYNRTNNKELLFITDENKIFFLKRYREILSPFIKTYCWCLLPNHFHFLIKIKSDQEIRNFLTNEIDRELTIIEKKFLSTEKSIGELIEHAFKRFFQSYALAYNKMYKRSGNLFYKPFKRVKIERDTQFTMAIIYVHSNAVKHGLVKNIKDYPWSSWHTILSSKPTSLAKNEIIEWFGDLENCIRTHEGLTTYYFNSPISIED